MESDATVRLPPAQKKIKLLLVEDEANIAAMVVDWLSEKYDIVVADTGKAALQKAAAEQPALILEDINLPDMTGYDVVKMLEKDSRTSAIPVIFLTGEKMVDETVKFIATVKNVKGYVNKPFRLQEFLEKVGLILDHKTDFVVMEKRSPTPESLEKAERFREVRASSARDAARPDGPPAAAPAVKPPKKRGFFGALFSMFFFLGFWGLWGLLAAGGAAELTCRFIEGLVGEWIFIPPLAPISPGVVGALPPGTAWERNGVAYRANSLGLRDEEAPAPSTGTFRALAFGGSALFGQDVPLDAVFSKKLEALLNGTDLFSSAGTHRVIHAGLWGLSLEDQWTAYEQLQGRLKPDLALWVAGESPRRPSQQRLREMGAWPAQLHDWVEKSRLAGLLEMLYLYDGGRAAGLPGSDLAGRVDRFLQSNPGTPLVILRLGRADRLDKLPPRENLLVFEVDKIVGPDLSWKGLAPRGHDALARTVLPLLQKYKDRIKPPPVPAVQLPQAPAPEMKNPAHRPRKKRG